VDGDQFAPLEVRLRPWVLVAPLLPFSLVMVSAAVLLRDSDRLARAFGIAILTVVALVILVWSLVITITHQRQRRVRLDAEGLTLGSWPRIPWSEIREVRMHELKGLRITRTPTRIVAFIPADPAAVDDTISRATGPLLRPMRANWSPYQTPLVISSAQLPVPVERLLEAVRRLSDAPIGPGTRLSIPARRIPRRVWGVALVAAMFVVALGVIVGILVSAPG
jgi:hypothetical protein